MKDSTSYPYLALAHRLARVHEYGLILTYADILTKEVECSHDDLTPYTATELAAIALPDGVKICIREVWAWERGRQERVAIDQLV